MKIKFLDRKILSSNRLIVDTFFSAQSLETVRLNFDDLLFINAKYNKVKCSIQLKENFSDF